MLDRRSKKDMPFAIRKAIDTDADSIVTILTGIASERIYTAINRPWSSDQQRQYIASLSPREAVYVAEIERKAIIGYQTLELWAPTLDSMAHVGQIGTFLSPDWRHRGVGEALFYRTVEFARRSNYVKFVIQVRSSNLSAQAFYRRLGFRDCGRLTRQVRIEGLEDDEIIMEFFL